MKAGWVAVGVRSRGLLQRRLGEEGARRVASSSSLEMALAELAPSHYGRALRGGMDLVLAEHALFETVLFDLRILAGWSPPLAAGPLRALAGLFEIDNVVAHLSAPFGVEVPAPFELGSLASAWPALSTARNAAEMRRSLAFSAWGDPGTDDPFGIRLALELRWARRVVEEAPAASAWARARATLTLGRLLDEGGRAELPLAAQRDADRVLGGGWRRAGSRVELLDMVHAFRLTSPTLAEGGPWLGEVTTWTLLEDAANIRRLRADAGEPIRAAQLLLLDAWRTRAALVLAERGGGDLGTELDALA